MNSGFGAARLIDCIAAMPAGRRDVAQAAHHERREGEVHTGDEAGADGAGDGQRAGEAGDIEAASITPPPASPMRRWRPLRRRTSAKSRAGRPSARCTPSVSELLRPSRIVVEQLDELGGLVGRAGRRRRARRAARPP